MFDRINSCSAAIRKLQQELGIPCDTFKENDFTNVLTVKYAAHSDSIWGESEIDHVLVVKKDVKLNLNPEEVAEASYFSMEEVFEVG